MKQGWEIKKLGEVSDFQGGSQPPKDEWISEPREGYIRMLQIRDFTQSRSFEIEYVKISNRLKYCNEEDVLLGRYGASVGKVLTGLAGAYNVAIMKTMPNKDLLNKSYFKYFLESPSFQVFLQQASTMRAAQAGFSKEDIQDFTIPVPPREEQERIVAELDCLSGVIEKKREQLKQLDALEQSIFYQMFGDPITNEKGWEVSTIENVCSSIVRGPFGSALKKEYFVEQSNTTYKVYEQKHAIQKDSSIGTYYISADMFETLSRFEIKEGDIIMSCSGTIGEFYEIPIGAEKGIMNQALLKYTLNKNIHKIYFLYVMEWVKENFEKKGSGLQNIGSVKTIKSTDISLPPLTLQQEFADKIEAIEKQKELISQSIKEVEDLFNSRMDYYFN